MKATEIDLEQLRRACAMLLAYLENDRGTIVPIEHDYYWEMPDWVRFDLHAKPSEFVMGQLSDDWGELQRVADGHSIAEYVGLQRLGYLLVALGQESIGWPERAAVPPKPTG